MPKPKLKTRPTTVAVDEFLATIDNEKRVADCRRVMGMMTKASHKPAKMWGPSIIGFGTYQYRYESGREGEMCIVGLSPRKDALSLYLTPGVEKFDDLLQRLGKYKTGKACLYIKNLDDVDQQVLCDLIKASFSYVTEHYPTY